MTLTQSDHDDIRQIVRQELRRERRGIRCPDCGAKQMPAEVWDEYSIADDEVWGCNCGFEAPPSEYKHATP